MTWDEYSAILSGMVSNIPELADILPRIIKETEQRVLAETAPAKVGACSSRQGSKSRVFSLLAP